MYAYNEAELEILSLFEQYKNADNDGKSSVSSKLKTKYYKEAERESVYNANISALRDYKHTKSLTLPDYRNLRYSVLYSSPYLLAYSDNKTGEIFISECMPYEKLDYLEIYIFGIELNLINLVTAEFESRDDFIIGNKHIPRRPFYLYYPCCDYAFVLSIADISPMFAMERLVLFFNETTLNEFLSDGYAALPSVCVNFPTEKIASLRTERNERQNKLINASKEWYKENDRTVISNVLSGKPRILFSYGSFKNNFLGRAILNIFSCFANKGYDVKFVEEKSLIHMNFKYPFYEEIFKYKPDIVFMSCNSRGEYDLPKELFFVSWITEVHASVGPPTRRDLIISMTSKTEELSYEFAELCKDEDFLVVPLLASPYLFKKQKLSGDDIKKYSCDIAILATDVSSSRMRKKWLCPQIDTLLEKCGLHTVHIDKIEGVIEKIDSHIEKLIYNEYSLYKIEDIILVYIDYFKKELEAHEFNDAFVRALASRWAIMQVSIAYRQAVIRWIIEAGFTNLKLYGYMIDHVEEFQQFYMGPVDIDEIQKLYSGAKITVGTTYFHNTSLKMLEAIFCDCMYLANHIDERYVFKALPPAYKDGENIVFFYSREDMVKKLKYYLEHDEERIEMARRTKETAIEHSSYKPHIAKIMDKLKEMAKDL